MSNTNEPLPCPACGGVEITALELGLGILHYTCAACGHTESVTGVEEWNALPRTERPKDDEAQVQGINADRVLWVQFFNARASFQRVSLDFEHIAREADEMLRLYKERFDG